MKAAALLLLVLLLGACGGQGESDSDAAPRSTASSSPDEPSGTGGPDADPIDSPTCAQVRAGIAAFNNGDLEATVTYFEKAVPLAESAAAAAGSDDVDAADLLEAVQYYANLPAEDYQEASTESPLFAKYKAITLGQCQPAPVNPDDPDDSGPTANA